MECVSWDGGADRAERVCVRRSGVTAGRIVQQARMRPSAVRLVFIFDTTYARRQFDRKITISISFQFAFTALISCCRVFQTKTKPGRWCVQSGGMTSLGRKRVRRSDIPGEKRFNNFLFGVVTVHLRVYKHE